MISWPVLVYSFLFILVLVHSLSWLWYVSIPDDCPLLHDHSQILTRYNATTCIWIAINCIPFHFNDNAITCLIWMFEILDSPSLGIKGVIERFKWLIIRLLWFIWVWYMRQGMLTLSGTPSITSITDILHMSIIIIWEIIYTNARWFFTPWGHIYNI